MSERGAYPERDASATWVFGYGSLIWRPGFAFEERRLAEVVGFERRLDQGSPDHRGTPERLGRVANLVPRPGARCVGVAYRLPLADADAILAALDVREQGGYERAQVSVTRLDGVRGSVTAVTWIAPAGNPYDLGPAPLDSMAAQIRDAVGPSGRNEDYVRHLDEALSALGHPDAHIRAVITALG